MRPMRFAPEVHEGDERFVLDRTAGLVWHRVFHRPLYADTDSSQVVYHANYLRYFELGRTALMRDVGYPYRDVEERGFVYPIVDLSIRFHEPLRYDDPMWVHTRPVRLERIRVTFDYLITHAETGAVICRGHTTHCALNRSGRPTPVDEAAVRMWQEFPR